MKIVRADQFQTVSWKNGAGRTREIAQDKSPGPFSWRFSLAEVSHDGPFSVFPDMSRVLTVVKGNGMTLHGKDSALSARRLRPLNFSGDMQVDGVLCSGPVLNFNLIYDPKRIAPDVDVIRDQRELNISAPADELICLFVVSGSAQVSGEDLSPHDVVICEDDDLSARTDRATTSIVARLRKYGPSNLCQQI